MGTSKFSNYDYLIFLLTYHYTIGLNNYKYVTKQLPLSHLIKELKNHG